MLHRPWARVHLTENPTTHRVPTVVLMILRAAATALAGVTGLYVLAWRLAVSLDETEATATGLVVRLS